jgi:uncharacterized membrane protein YgaE (UPF0421/DUF939 family)
MRPQPPNKKALKRSFWASLGRLVGIMLGAGAGSLLYQLIGSASASSVSVAVICAVMAFLLVWWAEYEREISDD